MYKYLILIILFYACEITTSPTIPPIYDDETVIYNVNLKSINSGENIDYVKEQQAKLNEEHKKKIAEEVNNNLMGSEDAWLKRKQEESLEVEEVETEEIQINTNN